MLGFDKGVLAVRTLLRLPIQLFEEVAEGFLLVAHEADALVRVQAPILSQPLEDAQVAEPDALCRPVLLEELEIVNVELLVARVAEERRKLCRLGLVRLEK